MKRRGISLLELLVAIAMTAIVTIGAVNAYSVATNYHLRVIPERTRYEKLIDFERGVQDLISKAFVDGSDRTFFVIGYPGGGSSGTSNPGEGDSITFTVRGFPIPGGSMSSTDDFETQHQNFGPVGGVREITLSTTAFGDAGEQTGLFLREQSPSDGDPTQGGFESNLSADVVSMTFEAWDGLQWSTVWDTTIEETPRLPAAIRVTYRLQGDDEDDERQFLIRLPLSDITPTNPLATGERP